MGRFTVRLPDTLHRDLMAKAKNEGVSLNQYVVFALTKQLTESAYTMRALSSQEIEEQRAQFASIMAELGPPDREAAAQYLSTREVEEPESKEVADLIAKVQEKIAVVSDGKPQLDDDQKSSVDATVSEEVVVVQ